MKAWLFQDHRQKQKLGDKAPWSVGWYDLDGKKTRKRVGSHSAAVKHQRKIEGQLAAGTYESDRRKKWSDFRAEYEAKGMGGSSPGTVVITGRTLDHFERIINPGRVNTITSKTFAEYVAKRKGESSRGHDTPKEIATKEAALAEATRALELARKKRPADVAQLQETVANLEARLAVLKGAPAISAATVNLELRHLRAVIRKAHKWGYLPRVPEIEFLREAGKLPTYVTPEHFAKLYQHADAARWPGEGHYTAAEWWQGLFVMAYMTGWRIGQILALQWADVDLEAGFALSRAADNKGKRDVRIPLHPLAVEHLRKLVCFSSLVFAWGHDKRALYAEFEAIQKAAGVAPEGTKARYGFHDFRRAFATMNAGTLTADALQALMQHRDYQTTQRYINMARQLKPAMQALYVPSLTSAGTAG